MFFFSLCCTNSRYAVWSFLQFVKVKAFTFFYLDFHFVNARTPIMIKANLAWSGFSFFFWMLAFSCQIASWSGVAMLSVNSLGWNNFVVPNPIPASPFPIRAGGIKKTGRRTSTASLITIPVYVSTAGPSGFVSKYEIAVGITTFYKDKNGKG